MFFLLLLQAFGENDLLEEGLVDTGEGDEQTVDDKNEETFGVDVKSMMDFKAS